MRQWRVATSFDSIKNDSWSPDVIRLVGVEHGTIGRRMIKGTLAFHLLIAIKQRYPELKPAIVLAYSSRREPRPIEFRSRQV